MPALWQCLDLDSIDVELAAGRILVQDDVRVGGNAAVAAHTQLLPLAELAAMRSWPPAPP